MPKITCSAATDLGKVRDSNEDNFYVNGKFKEYSETPHERFFDDREREQYLYAVYDGMGGEQYGRLASLIAVKTLVEYQSADFRKAVNDYVKKANKLICDEIEKNNGVRIGTTIAIVHIKDGNAVSCNIGDSRVYLFRNNRLIQLSEDHTQAQRLVKMGIIKKDAARSHKDRHKLTQHLGIFPDEFIIQLHISKDVAVKQSDIFLLCSDGLTDMVSDEIITEILSSAETDTTDLAGKLVKTALENGGKDNITAVVVKIN